MKTTAKRQFDLTQELRRIAERLQTEEAPRPHRAASALEAFDLIQTEATRLLVDAGIARGAARTEVRLKGYVVARSTKEARQAWAKVISGRSGR